MEAFYLIALSIAAILLILILTYIGIVMANNKNKKSQYPPQSGSCPDYWSISTVDPSSCIIPARTDRNAGTKIVDASGKSYTSIYDVNGALLLNASNTGGLNTSQNSINFGDPKWITSGVSAICAQKTWANTFGIVWDGVSNYNSC
jgi:hypothetical protein